MISFVFYGLSLTGAAALLIVDPATLGIWGVLVSSMAGLGAQFLKMREDAAREERKHRFAMDERDAALRARAAIQDSIDENTAITRDVGMKASQAYDTANHINEKLLRISQGAASDRAVALETRKEMHEDALRRTSTLRITLPVRVRNAVLGQMRMKENVSLYADSSGTIRGEGGAELHFSPVGDTDEVLVTVISNPANLSALDIAVRLQSDVTRMIADASDQKDAKV